MTAQSKVLDSGVEVRHFKPQEAGNSDRTLVLLHGLGAGVNSWGRFPRALGRPAIAFDVAKSPKLGPMPSMRACAHLAVEAIREVVGDRKVGIIGYSWGGMLAQQIALDHEPRVERLVLAATLPAGMYRVSPHSAARQMLLSGDRSDATLESLAGDAYGGKVRNNWRLASRVGLGKESSREGYGRQIAAAASAALNHLSNYSRLRRLGTPTLIITGDDDPFVSPRHSQKLYELIPNSELSIIEGEGHLVLLTSPIESAAAINNILNQPEPESSPRHDLVAAG